MSQRCYFSRHDDWFKPTEWTRGPWDQNACHAGPPTGLLARASELAVSDAPLVRITVDLLRPIPMSGFRVESEVVRAGRTVSTTQIRLLNSEGTAVAIAAGMHVNGRHNGPFPTVEPVPPEFDAAVDGPFVVSEAGHGMTWFGHSLEAKYPPGEDRLPGPTTMWMRTIPLLADEDPSPFQRICPLADCGNAVSRNAEVGHAMADSVTFLNTDLTIMLHRPPVGQWLATDATSYWQPSGNGISDAILFDRQGTVGRALQTLLVTRQ